MVPQVQTQQAANNAPFLDPTIKCLRTREFDEQLSALIIAQENGVQDVGNLYQLFLAGMNQCNKPLGTLLFLGPTGFGKTRVVEAAAEILFGDRNAVIKIDCAEFQHSHEIAKLVGSAPGISKAPRNFTNAYSRIPRSLPNRRDSAFAGSIR